MDEEGDPRTGTTAKVAVLAALGLLLYAAVWVYPQRADCRVIANLTHGEVVEQGLRAMLPWRSDNCTILMDHQELRDGHKLRIKREAVYW